GAVGDRVRVEEHRLRVLLLSEELVGRPVLDVPQLAIPLVGEGDAVLLFFGLGKPSARLVDPERRYRGGGYAAFRDPCDKRVRPLHLRRTLRLPIGSLLPRWPVTLAPGRPGKAAMVAVPDRASVLFDRYRQALVGLLA